MRRVVILGRGGAGKSTFARSLSEITGIPAVQLDEHFWSDTLDPLSQTEWAARQATLVADDRWILDGDLGPYDVLEARLHHADTVVVLDYSFARAAWRAARRSRERADFWLWVWRYRRRSRPAIRTALAVHAAGAEIHWLVTPRQARRLLTKVASDR
jgi:adenylate kinase family enzyme